MIVSFGDLREILFFQDPILSTQIFGAAEARSLPTQRIGAAASGVLATQTFRGVNIGW